MKPLALFAVSMLVSVLLYLGVFGVVQRSLTLDGMAPLITHKLAHAQSLPSPRLLLLAGSNGRYSHRCQVLQSVTGLPCSNLSLAVGVGLDFQLRLIDPLLRPGDVLYLPLEYSQYRVSQDEMESGAENTLLVHHFRDQLWLLPMLRIARAYGSFDLPFLTHGLLEMALARTGVERRRSAANLTPEGDEHGHTAASGHAFKNILRSARFDDAPLPVQSHALRVIDAFLSRAAKQSVQVIGGLPTTPDSMVLDGAVVVRLQELFARHGHAFLVLPSRSQYPLHCFFDTLYHLHEQCQLQHSQALGEALLPLLPPRPRAQADAR